MTKQISDSRYKRSRASEAERWFLVEGRCIGCMVCAEIAPETFVRRDDRDQVALGRQPADAAAIARCEEACDLCPVDAIAMRCDVLRPKSG